MNDDLSPDLSRRGLLRLSLGGAAALAATPGLARSRGMEQRPQDASDGLSRATPESQGIASSAIMDFLDDMDRHAYELHGMMLWRNGHVVAEGWWAPYGPQRIHMTHSLTKSVTACAVGLALGEGRFKLDDKVVSFFPEHLPATVSPYLAAMTVRDLLTMRTGHAGMVSGSVWRPIKTSWIAEFYKIPVEFEPGTRFVYTSAATYMLSAIITRTTGQSTADYLKSRFFDPLGISGHEWDVGPEGISPGANGLSWKTVDALKLGIVHAQGGQWNGRQVLPREWVEAVQQPHTPGKYGYQWWLGPQGIYYASGLFDQDAIVFPEHNAVLAINSGNPQRSAVLRTVVYRHFPTMFKSKAVTAKGDAGKLPRRLRQAQLMPPPAPSSSPVAGEVSGRLFEFADNDQQIRSVRLDFSAGECRFTLVDDRGTHVVRCGLGRTVEDDTTITGNKLHHEYQPERMRVVASGEWKDARSFEMTWIFVESAFRDTVVCRFAGPYLRLSRSVNINSSATELPALTSKLPAGA
jgi:CubicO group peptidase (beta-lactamase class C family)